MTEALPEFGKGLSSFILNFLPSTASESRCLAGIVDREPEFRQIKDHVVRQREHGAVAFLTVVALAVGGLPGCGWFGGSPAPPSYGISGNVTYNQQPLASGTIEFSPDVANGNSGPNVTATIENGKYQIARSEGAVCGPMIVQITSTGGGQEMPAPYREEVDLPEEDTQKDFEVAPSRKK